MTYENMGQQALSLANITDGLRSRFPVPKVDEIAFIVGDAEEAALACQARGLVKFNEAEDVVRYSLADGYEGEYSVHYDFLSVLGSPRPGFRIELMHITGGDVSPAHQTKALQVQGKTRSRYMPVHASFRATKHGDEREPLVQYTECTRMMRGLNDLHLFQHNVSTYGQFSYWRSGMLPPALWLKPRVNLRDGLLALTEEQI